MGGRPTLRWERAPACTWRSRPAHPMPRAADSRPNSAAALRASETLRPRSPARVPLRADAAKACRAAKLFPPLFRDHRSRGPVSPALGQGVPPAREATMMSAVEDAFYCASDVDGSLGLYRRLL